jgi:NADPH2:quinone reductase
MKVVTVDESSPDRALRITDTVVPPYGPNEVQIAVKAAGVNRADLLQRAGKYPPPPGASEVLGLEVAGVVEAVGDHVETFRVGDAVCALLTGGGYAEVCSVPEGQVMHIPPGFSFVEGAAIPEAFLTAYTNLFVEGGLAAGERVLIHGGASGVGTAVIQLAKVVGAHVACTVGSEEKAERCRALGAECAICYPAVDFADDVLRWSGEQGVDLVLDIVGKEYLARNLRVLRPRGRCVVIATQSGAVAELDLRVLMQKRLRLIGSVLRSRSEDEKSALVAGFVERFYPKFEDGSIKPVIDSVFPIENANDAHTLMSRSGHVGKIVLSFT